MLSSIDLRLIHESSATRGTCGKYTIILAEGIARDLWTSDVYVSRGENPEYADKLKTVKRASQPRLEEPKKGKSLRY